MITRQQGFPRTYATYPTVQWMAHSGRASWSPAAGPAYTSQSASTVPHNGAQWFQPVKPRLMMDPSDPSTWQRPYVFTT